MKVFCMSDIHGCLKEFKSALSIIINELEKADNKLILLGDYIHQGPNSKEVLDMIMDLQKKYGEDKIIALLGNHEEYVLENMASIDKEMGLLGHDDLKYVRWFKKLPRYYVLNNTIFVHAGIDEEAGAYWQLGTTDETYTMKYPASLGPVQDLNQKIVAGHISTSTITKNPNYHDIFYDGASHYYIDGDVLKSHNIPILMIENDNYYKIYKERIYLIK